MSSYYLYTGIVAGLYSVYAGLKYYALSGTGLVSPKEVKEIGMDHIIDVRTKLEWNMGHHIDAIHIPVQNLTKKTMDKLKMGKEDKILVYCNTGQRARRAAEFSRKLGYKNVYYIENSYTSLK